MQLVSTGRQIRRSASLSVWRLPIIGVDTVVIWMILRRVRQRLPGNGPLSGTVMLIEFVQSLAVKVGNERSSTTFCTAWNDVSNFGSPLSAECAIEIELTPTS